MGYNDFPSDNDAIREAAIAYRAERDRREGFASAKPAVRQVWPMENNDAAGCDDVPFAPLSAYCDGSEPMKGGAATKGRAIRPEPERASRFFSASALDGQGIPERKWLVPDLIPSRRVTLLYGDGGTGKTLLSLQLSVAVATGDRRMGRDTAEGLAVFHFGRGRGRRAAPPP